MCESIQVIDPFRAAAQKRVSSHHVKGATQSLAMFVRLHCSLRSLTPQCSFQLAPFCLLSPYIGSLPCVIIEIHEYVNFSVETISRNNHDSCCHQKHTMTASQLPQSKCWGEYSMFPISAPGALEIKKEYCHLTLLSYYRPLLIREHILILFNSQWMILKISEMLHEMSFKELLLLHLLSNQ